MKILIIGNGGRESAIAWNLKQDTRVEKLYFSHGNAMTEELGENIHETSISELVAFAKKEKIYLTIVGPEAPLVEGIVDEFDKNELLIFGANKKAASLEGSKAFSKKFMSENGIKTAKAEIFNSYIDAKSHIASHTYPLVIKASGLAGGKGVVICETQEEAENVLQDFMIRRIYGDAGIQVIVEEYLKGFEASIIAFSNGETLYPCIAAKDYKKVGDGEKGLNTGGMGAVAPNPQFHDMHQMDFEKNILAPTLAGLKKENLNFKGVIFFGLMITDAGCYLLEYNMRFGDPETQVLMPLLENSLIDVIQNCLDGKPLELRFSNKKAVCVTMVSGGYPRTIETDMDIIGIDRLECPYFLAGVKRRGDSYLTSGGRVINIVGVDDTYEDAKEIAYDNVKLIQFDFGFYRKDIGN